MAEDSRELDQNTVALTSRGKTSRLLKPGDIIGDSYRLKGLIGRGGMGYVFRAEHIMMGEDYALKMLAPDHINAVTWNRFQAEGKAIARLDHPNIVKIYNMGIDRGDCPYYVMDLLDGIALSDCIQGKKPFTIDEILQMFMQLASGFGYAHSRGIIHRDVKPSNVVLVDDGGQYPTAKIVDFGIAKVSGGDELHNQSQTATGEIFGSPFYMSPEQCLGTQIDHRSDIYSFGCTLFEVLCGKPPFVGESVVQTVMMHQNKPSPTIESVSGKFCGDEMEALVAKMLMKRPVDRYQSMDQVLHDLDRIWQRKAVGKNVETGFKSSVNTRLEDLGSRLEEDEQIRTRRKRISIVCAIAVVGLAAVVSAGVMIEAARPPTDIPKAPAKTDFPSVKEYNAENMQHSKEEAAIAEKLKGVKSISSSIDKADGRRVFHCPDMPLGTFTWWLGAKGGEGANPFDQGHGTSAAQGDASVPADRPIWLFIRCGGNREVLLYPDVLKKFGPKELIGLELHAGGPIDEIYPEAAVKLVKTEITRLVKAISGWSNCQYVEFYNLPATDEALIALDQHKTLHYFVALHAGINASVLAKRQFLRQLTFFELAEEDSSEQELCALSGSSAITTIDLQHTSAAAKGLRALANCPNLKSLTVDGCSMDSAGLEALSGLKSLKELKILEDRGLPQRLDLWRKLAFIPNISVELTGWSEPMKKEFIRALPRASVMRAIQQTQSEE